MIAKQTLDLINERLRADQGGAYRQLLAKYIPMADDVYRGQESPFRAHLGASILGRECAREIWYSFRWTTRKFFEGRILRLFNRGHLEEPRFLALLEMIGCEVWSVTSDGKQFKVKGHFGHSGGSLDAVIRGIPECPQEPLLSEFKTHSEKSFDKLKDEGVLKTKWEHFVQQQIYMGKNNLRGSLYMAVNKNTDEIHAELVAFDPTQYARYEQRAAMIINAKVAPPKINKNPSWFKCKFCDHKDVCHGNALPEKTCRSCEHSVLDHDGRWLCGLRQYILTSAQQEIGCPDHRMMLDAFKAQP